ncbi:hypothetical protein [Bradyrhizobium sp.]|uniref:hypothetical protein n=1 Tax=Bradyrhizobium sp. TaxID=376 RepID=UPI0026277B4E|nr:hypothetical protein [Bradyrhizobium sp.]
MRRHTRRYARGCPEQVRALAASAKNIPIELQAALIALRHLLSSEALAAWIELRTMDAIFRDRHFNGDATAFAQSLLVELRPCLGADDVRRMARERKRSGVGNLSLAIANLAHR